MKIVASEYIKSGFSGNDVQKIKAVIECAFSSGEIIEIDFENVRNFTTFFFNNAITFYVLSLGPEEFNKRFSLINLSEVGEKVYSNSLKNAVNIFNMSSEQIEQYNTITSNPNVGE